MTRKEKFKWFFSIVKNSLTGCLLPLFDIGTDLFAAGTHFYWGDASWGALTLFFVGLPGLVCGLAVAIFGLKKSFSLRRLINFSICILLGPFVYPLIQIFVSGYMVFLMVVQKDRTPVKLMGHDVKQFKSLEGFLESGPQFVLQSYILLRGQKRDVNDIREESAKRILTLLLSIALSLASLSKTSINVNKPDPDDRRQSKQYPELSPKFLLTSILFNGFCVVFRLSSAAFFYATVRSWANLILFSIFIVNAVLFGTIATSNYVLIILLGAVSIFVPNGYLLYNFAGVFPVDFTFRQTKLFLFSHMSLVTGILLVSIALIMGFYNFGEVYEHTHLGNTVLSSNKIFYGLGSTIELLGIFSVVLFVVHWYKSIAPLYSAKEETVDNEA